MKRQCKYCNTKLKLRPGGFWICPKIECIGRTINDDFSRSCPIIQGSTKTYGEIEDLKELRELGIPPLLGSYWGD